MLGSGNNMRNDLDQTIRSLFGGRTCIKGRALLIGERLDLQALGTTDFLALAPLVISAGENGCAVLFRYGAVVLFDLTPLEEVSFLTQLRPLVRDPFAETDIEVEEAELEIQTQGGDLVENGVARLRDLSVNRLQVVADALAKSAVLSHYETTIASVFDDIEPLAVDLSRTGSGRRRDKELLRRLGGILLSEHKMVGMVEISEKPETLWELPELERLYARLEDEYELNERHLALERKLQLLSRTAETVLNLLQHNSSLRVEWYIVVLIVVEIFLILYDMMLRH